MALAQQQRRKQTFFHENLMHLINIAINICFNYFYLKEKNVIGKFVKVLMINSDSQVTKNSIKNKPQMTYGTVLLFMNIQYALLKLTQSQGHVVCHN